jgi:transcriptional regulator with XRE-family HTH domain
MQLSDYLKENELTDEAFGEKIGRDRSSVYRLKNSQTKPTADVLQAIVNATGGAVTPNDFFDLPDAAEAA